ncbi:MAG TPA: hypothetical protein VK647_14970 [Gemmatimonadales bacterium]|jgi:hypothetical protein|nr:hypothetical protein [Gemmatimonadales bacterium]
MRSPALAIAWEFRRRHLWVLIALAGYLLVLAAIKVLIHGPWQPVTLDPPDGRVGVAMVPLSTTFFYFLAVFSFGLAGDLGARQSIYPARMFALPVTTKALAGWPMLYGAATMTSLWLGTALFARWPWGMHLPLIWPALLAVVFLAWTQALTWMPYGLPGLRVIVTVLWLATLDAAVLLALHSKVPEAVLLAVLAPQLPLAYAAACFAVARARCGDVPDWRGMFARPAGNAVLTRWRDRFPSPARAQAWFEWRRHGRSLPALVGLLLPFELALLWLAKDAPAFVFEILFLVLITPPFVAAFTGWTGSKPHPNVSDSYGVPPFSATRPLTSAELIGAKLKMAMWSTLAAWGLVFVTTPLALAWSGAWPVLIERAQRMNDAIGTPRAVVFVLLILAGFIVSTWKQLVQSLHIVLTGRPWLIKGSVLLTLTFLILLGPIVEWIIDSPSVQGALWNALPLILAGLVGLKMSAAAWIATRLERSRLLGDRALVAGAACWCVAVLALYGVLVWFFSTPFVARYVLALIAILAVPLARLSAAPLALAWNRHR